MRTYNGVLLTTNTQHMFIFITIVATTVMIGFHQVFYFIYFLKIIFIGKNKFTEREKERATKIFHPLVHSTGSLVNSSLSKNFKNLQKKEREVMMMMPGFEPSYQLQLPVNTNPGR